MGAFANMAAEKMLMWPQLHRCQHLQHLAVPSALPYQASLPPALSAHPAAIQCRRPASHLVQSCDLGAFLPPLDPCHADRA